MSIGLSYRQQQNQQRHANPEHESFLIFYEFIAAHKKMYKKSETELTASILKKDPKHTRD